MLRVMARPPSWPERLVRTWGQQFSCQQWCQLLLRVRWQGFRDWLARTNRDLSAQMALCTPGTHKLMIQIHNPQHPGKSGVHSWSHKAKEVLCTLQVVMDLLVKKTLSRRWPTPLPVNKRPSARILVNKRDTTRFALFPLLLNASTVSTGIRSVWLDTCCLMFLWESVVSDSLPVENKPQVSTHCQKWSRI